MSDLAEKYGDQALALALDVTDRTQITAAVQAATDTFGGVDVLVNNAGYGYLSAVEAGEDAEIRALFDTNYFGALYAIQAVLPGMRDQGWVEPKMPQPIASSRQVLARSITSIGRSLSVRP